MTFDQYVIVLPEAVVVAAVDTAGAVRHTGNHFAAASGASTRELMGRMGHASMRAALIYQHRTVERDRMIADALDSMLRAGE